MQMQISPDGLMRGLAEELGKVAADKVGGEPALQPTTSVSGAGWLMTIPVAGAATGKIVAWFERASTAVWVQLAEALGAPPDDEAITRSLRASLGQALNALELTPAAAGLTTTVPVVSPGEAPANALAYEWPLPSGEPWRFAVVAEVGPAPAAIVNNDTRLEAVLDVDLPLVVRFGRAVMPLRALAELGPGAVVDMGRSPDEPVELLVGERLIARGEVVIVAGNYGVRITELTSGRRASDTEGRL